MSRIEKCLYRDILVVSGILISGILITLALTPVHASDSCCSDRAVMARGIQAAHKSLSEGDTKSAISILEKVAEATRVPL